MPIRQVVLFNSGVGYFQREGEVDGNTRVELSFPVGDINDLVFNLSKPQTWETVFRIRCSQGWKKTSYGNYFGNEAPGNI